MKADNLNRTTGTVIVEALAGFLYLLTSLPLLALFACEAAWAKLTEGDDDESS